MAHRQAGNCGSARARPFNTRSIPRACTSRLGGIHIHTRAHTRNYEPTVHRSTSHARSLVRVWMCSPVTTGPEPITNTLTYSLHVHARTHESFVPSRANEKPITRRLWSTPMEIYCTPFLPLGPFSSILQSFRPISRSMERYLLLAAWHWDLPTRGGQKEGENEEREK